MKTPTAHRIDLVEIEKITPYEKNPRHNEKAIAAVAASLQEFGFRQAIVCDSKMVIICGHTRYKAAQHLKLKRVPVHIAKNLTPDQAQAYRIADNQTGNIATWDMDLLPFEISSLQDGGYDLTLLGFDPTELRKILGPASGETDPDDIPETPTEAITQPGDLITLGQHCLLCGDSTSETNMATLMNGHKANMIFTDPPYNVNYMGQAGSIQNDNMANPAFYNFLLAAYQQMEKHLQPGGVIYVSHADWERLNFTAAFQDAGFKMAQTLIWVKHYATLSRKDYNWRHEPILYGWKPGGPHYWCEDYTLTTIIDDAGDPEKMKKSDLVNFVKTIQAHLKETIIRIDRPTKSPLHPTTKPTALVEQLINNSSKHADLILDPFLGSGTTLIAAHRTGRRCYGMEMSPQFCDVIIKRWEDYTGQTHERTATD